MPGSRPNILLFMVDQLTAQVLRPYGGGVCKTPNLDALAGRAALFENAYCNYPLCAPSRFSMMSGRLPSRIGAYDNGAEFAASTPTFAHYLRRLGYYTCISGKMHFVGPDQLHGFEERGREIDGLSSQVEDTGLDASDGEQVLDQATHPVRGAFDDAEVLLLLGSVHRHLEHQIGGGVDHSHRIPEVVRHDGEHLVSCTNGLLKRRLRLPNLREIGEGEYDPPPLPTVPHGSVRTTHGNRTAVLAEDDGLLGDLCVLFGERSLKGRVALRVRRPVGGPGKEHAVHIRPE